MPAGGLIDNLKTRVGLKKPEAPPISREQAMRALPVRNPSLQWRETDDGNIVVTLPRRSDLTGKLLAWVFFVPESKPISLDDVGTFVWSRCDGEHSMRDIVTALCAEYKMGRRETELSLIEFMKMLGKRGMIGFAVPQDLIAEIGDSAAALFGSARGFVPGTDQAAGDQPAGEQSPEADAGDDPKPAKP